MLEARRLPIRFFGPAAAGPCVEENEYVQGIASEAERARGDLQGGGSVSRLRSRSPPDLGDPHHGAALLGDGAVAPCTARSAGQVAERLVPRGDDFGLGTRGAVS